MLSLVTPKVQKSEVVSGLKRGSSYLVFRKMHCIAWSRRKMFIHFCVGFVGLRVGLTCWCGCV